MSGNGYQSNTDQHRCGYGYGGDETDGSGYGSGLDGGSYRNDRSRAEVGAGYPSCYLPDGRPYGYVDGYGPDGPGYRYGYAPRVAGLPVRRDDVAAVITCHDYGRYLDQCLDSVLAQSYPFAEIIVVDDASTDETREVAERRGACYLRGDWHSPAAARNAGLCVTSAPILAFIDADNWLMPDFVARLLPGLADLDRGLSYAPYVPVDEAGRPIHFACPVHPIDDDELASYNAIDTCCLVRREALASVGGWQPLPVVGYEDWHTWHRIVRRGWKRSYCPERLFCYRRHPAQISQATRQDLAYIEMQRSFDLAVVTPFCGRRELLPQVMRSYAQLDWPPERLHLVAVDNSCDPAFGDALRMVLDVTCRDWASVTVVRDGRRNSGDATQAEWASNAWLRNDGHTIGANMARVYMHAVRHLPPCCDLVLTIEDDIEIVSPQPLARLTEALAHDTVAVAGVVRSRFQTNRAGEPQVIVTQVRSWDPFDGSLVDDEPDRADIMEIDASHFACTLFRAFAWRLQDPRDRPLLARRSSVNGDGRQPWHDVASFSNWRRLGWRAMVHWGVRTRHWRTDGSWA